METADHCTWLLNQWLFCCAVRSRAWFCGGGCSSRRDGRTDNVIVSFQPLLCCGATSHIEQKQNKTVQSESAQMKISEMFLIYFTKLIRVCVLLILLGEKSLNFSSQTSSGSAFTSWNLTFQVWLIARCMLHMEKKNRLINCSVLVSLGAGDYQTAAALLIIWIIVDRCIQSLKPSHLYICPLNLCFPADGGRFTFLQ